MKSVRVKVVAILFSIFIFIITVAAQSARGFKDLQGEVRDQNGALIVGARVTVGTEAGKILETVSGIDLSRNTNKIAQNIIQTENKQPEFF